MGEKGVGKLSRETPPPREGEPMGAQPGGTDWVQCDICDFWYHKKCTDITISLDELEEMEWACDFHSN